MSTIFIDIDGVLNDHSISNDSGYCGILPICMSRWNSILRSTGAQVVISSAWRYMVLEGSMTLEGFRHGWYQPRDNIIGLIPRDVLEYSRAELCLQVPYDPVYVCIDDLDLGYAALSLPFVQTDGRYGLQDHDVIRIKEILCGK